MKLSSISSSSKGNCILVENNNSSILVDVGISRKKAEEGLEFFGKKPENIDGIVITHEHSDHFNFSTISRLALERPTLRFACGKFLLKKLVQAGVSYTKIDILTPGVWYRYNKDIAVSPIVLYHDVPNYGYRLLVKGKKIIYATDTTTLEGIKAYNYDYYLLEANYEEDEIQQKIEEKEKAGQFVYEYRVLKTHLSKEECDNFLLENIGEKSIYQYLHRHED